MLGYSQPKKFLSVLAGSASVIALMYSPVAVAQSDQPTASSGGGLEEVVVTARRKEEKAQSVPIIMNTFSSATLQNEEVKTVRDLGTITPSLSMTGTRDTTQYLWLRGVIGAVQYFNEVPMFNYGGFELAFDIANVQVLKGPQGTLFGQSADAGAILYVPKPTTNDFEGNVMIEAGDYDHRHMEAVVNVPIVDDKLVVRVGGLTNNTKGYQHDVVTGQYYGSEDYWIGRGTVTWRPTDDIQNDFLINFYNSDSVPNISAYWYVNPKGPNVTSQYGLGTVNDSIRQAKLGWYTYMQGTYRPGGAYSSVQAYIMTDTARWDINDSLTLKNIVGYQEWRPGTVNSPAFANVLEYPLGATANAQLAAHPLVPSAMVVQYSEELQLLGKAFDDKLSYTVGFFGQMGGQRQPSGPIYNVAYVASIGGSVSGAETWGNSRTIGLFAQGTYDLSTLLDGLSATAGYRYTWDKQHQFTETFAGTGKLNTAAPQLASFKAPSYNFSLDYQLTPSTLLYVTVSKGYSKGGFNTGNAAFDSRFSAYSPESLNNTEIGIKSDWEAFGVKARTNLGLYHDIYGKVQGISTQLVASPIPGVLPQATNLTLNAATASIEGFDAEITVVPTDDLSITANAGYVHFHYDTWINPFALSLAGVTTTDWAGTPQYYTPQLAWNIHATYQLPVLGWIAPGQDLGKLSLTAAYNWNGHVYGGLAGPGQQTSMNIAQSYDVINLNLNWRDMMGTPGLDGRLYVTNLGEDTNFVDNGAGYFSYGFTGRVPMIPREYGFSISYSFGPK